MFLSVSREAAKTTQKFKILKAFSHATPQQRDEFKN